MSQQVVIDYRDDNFWITVPYALNHLVQEIPERKWMKGKKQWRVPANWRSAEAMEPLKRHFWTPQAREAIDSLHRPSLPPPLLENPDFPWVHEPFEHQWEAYRIAMPLDYFALFFEQGLGKTKTAIDLQILWGVCAVLVICPVSIRQVWEREFEEQWPVDDMVPVDVQLLQTKGMREWRKDRIPVLVCGVESLSQGRAIDVATQFCREFVVSMIVDESSRVKTPGKIRTERAIELANMCWKRLILTGTPVTQGLHDLYSQFQVLAPSTLALTSFYAFRNRYCVMGGFENKQVVAYKNVDELMDLIAPWSLRKEKEDCLDLPEKVFQTRTVTLSAEQKKAYTELKKNLRTIIEDKGKKTEIEVDMVLTAYLRLQQICGGFYPVLDENGDLIEMKPIPGPNPKLNELLEVMGEIGPRKVIVWARFRDEVESIVQALERTGREVVQFHGGLDESEKKSSVERFQDGTANVFVATQQSASYGLTLTSAHTAVYYSMGFSLEEFLQSQDRIHRIGQTMSCDYTLLSCAGTVDSKVVTALRDKKSVADFVSEELQRDEAPF